MSRRDEWGTPQWLFDLLHAEFRFQLDVCASADNAKLPAFFSPETDGLSQRWHGPAWMNPPYARSELIRWLAKAVEQSKRTTVVGLIPAWTSAAYWHECVLPHASEIRFIDGRVPFVGPRKGNGRRGSFSPPFSSVVVVWQPNRATLRVGPSIIVPSTRRSANASQHRLFTHAPAHGA